MSRVFHRAGYGLTQGEFVRLAYLLLPFLLVGCGVSTEQAETDMGKETYLRYCFSCHQGGVAGAPSLGDVEAWAPRLDKGRDVLLQSVIDGIPPAMPIRGLCNSCSDEELAASVDYMLNAVRDKAREVGGP
ncbi:MAG: c-type cytochrome [Pseudomonadales bacterium]|nr:c-type cytochrome [Pseudomonadales bacterium]